MFLYMVDGENKPRVWLLVIRQSEITRNEDREKLSPLSWNPGTCSHAFREAGRVVVLGKWKRRVECIGMEGWL